MIDRERKWGNKEKKLISGKDFATIYFSSFQGETELCMHGASEELTFSPAGDGITVLTYLEGKINYYVPEP